MRKVIVLGATGKVGCYTALHLKDKGFDVTAVGKRKSDNGFFNDYGIDYVSVDILSQEDFKRLPQENVFAVIHMAAVLPAKMVGYEPRDYVESNIYGTMNVLDYAVTAGAERFVFPKSWSDVTYLTGSLKPIPADAPVKFPINDDHTIYAITKNAATDIVAHYAARYGFRYYILRFPNIFCYHPDPTYYVNGTKRWQGMWRIIEQAKRGEDIELWGDPMAARDFIYVKDCVQIVEKTLTAEGECGTYNVGTGKATTRIDQLKGIVEVFSPHDHPSQIVMAPEKPSAPFFLLDIQKTIDQLGYHPEYDYIRSLRDIKEEMENERFAKLWGRRVDYDQE